MKQSLPFHHPYRHDFVRVAVAVPRIRVADPAYNADADDLDAGAGRRRRRLAGRLPGAGPVGLHLRRPVPPARAARRLRGGAGARRRGDGADPGRSAIVGLPLRVDHLLFNCAAVVARRPRARRRAEDLPAELRRVLRGAPVQRRRHARSSTRCACSAHDVPFGADLIFEATNQPLLTLARRDLRGPVGADPAVDATRRWPARRCWSTSRPRTSRSARPTTGTSSSASSRRAASRPTCTRRPGSASRPPTSAWDGQALIYENGDLLAESRALRHRLALHQRRRRPRAPVARAHAAEHLRPVGRAARGRSCASFRRVALRAGAAARRPAARCARTVERFPYVPADPARRDERCAEVYNIQVQALVQRLSATGIEKLVIGVSGGLDSTQALLVCAAGDGPLGLPRSQHPRLHDARLRHQRRARSTRRSG